jgi:adenine deaminase
MRGGLAVAHGDRVVASLPLPIAGLMSHLPFEDVGRQLEKTIAAARDLGSPLHDPFMAMSFLALEVIPSLKLTDQGLVDVDRMETVPLFVNAK